MMHIVRVPFRVPPQSTVGMNLWLTQQLKLVYRQDWKWYSSNPEYGYYIYQFKDEQMATIFALRWVR